MRTRPARDLVLVVPRHNAQRPREALATVLDSVVRSSRKRAKVDAKAGHTRRPATSDNPDTFKAAIESASEWNSLLLTARAERGPQFDVATQQFHADEGSTLYYDPTPLRQQVDDEKPASPVKEARPSRRSTRGGDRGESASAAMPMRSPQLSRHPSMHGAPAPGMPSFDGRFPGLAPDGLMQMHGGRTMSSGPLSAGGMALAGAAPGFPGTPAHGQFFGDALPSPMRGGPGPGPMHGGMMPPGAYAQMESRRMTRGMSGGMMPDGFGGNMYGP